MDETTMQKEVFGHRKSTHKFSSKLINKKNQFFNNKNMHIYERIA